MIQKLRKIGKKCFSRLFCVVGLGHRPLFLFLFWKGPGHLRHWKKIPRSGDSRSGPWAKLIDSKVGMRQIWLRWHPERPFKGPQKVETILRQHRFWPKAIHDILWHVYMYTFHGHRHMQNLVSWRQLGLSSFWSSVVSRWWRGLPMFASLLRSRCDSQPLRRFENCLLYPPSLISKLQNLRSAPLSGRLAYTLLPFRK